MALLPDFLELSKQRLSLSGRSQLLATKVESREEPAPNDPPEGAPPANIDAHVTQLKKEMEEQKAKAQEAQAAALAEMQRSMAAQVAQAQAQAQAQQQQEAMQQQLKLMEERHAKALMPPLMQPPNGQRPAHVGTPHAGPRPPGFQGMLPSQQQQATGATPAASQVFQNMASQIPAGQASQPQLSLPQATSLGPAGSQQASLPGPILQQPDKGKGKGRGKGRTRSSDLAQAAKPASQEPSEVLAFLLQEHQEAWRLSSAVLLMVEAHQHVRAREINVWKRDADCTWPTWFRTTPTLLDEILGEMPTLISGWYSAPPNYCIQCRSPMLRQQVLAKLKGNAKFRMLGANLQKSALRTYLEIALTSCFGHIRKDQDIASPLRTQWPRGLEQSRGEVRTPNGEVIVSSRILGGRLRIAPARTIKIDDKTITGSEIMTVIRRNSSRFSIQPMAMEFMIEDIVPPLFNE